MLLTKLGMTPSNADHKWFVIQFDGLPPIRTKLSHTKKKDVGLKLEGRMHKQLRVRSNFFRELMDCTKDSTAKRVLDPPQNSKSLI